ncbi:hypothetical protein Tco_1083719 [Tanacetum coccineum]
MDSEKEAQKPEEEAAEYEKEKEELRLSLKIISNDDSEVDYEPLSRKFPIVNWEYQLLGKMEEKDMYVYKLTRADGIHTLFMDGKPMEINMLVEKKYPLINELLEKMLNLQLEAEEEKVIVNGDAPAITSASIEGPIPPKAAEQKLARKNELKGKSTLLLAIPDEHLLKFHGIKDAKTLWEAIKTRFGGNKESKKM